MALSDIIASLASKSGRADLNIAPYTDAIGYINAGQRLLDKLSLKGNITTRRFANIASSAVFTYIKYCRTIEDIWLYSGDERTKLNKVTLNEIKEYYNEPKGSITAGTPVYYAFEHIRPIGLDATKPEIITNLALFTQQWALDNTIVDGSWHGYTGIITMPPADTGYTIEISGQFKSIPLDITNNTKSYWSEELPDVLIWAALYHMEIDYRNTEGAKDWKGAIEAAMDLENMDIVENELNDTDMEMGG